MRSRPAYRLRFDTQFLINISATNNLRGDLEIADIVHFIRRHVTVIVTSLLPVEFLVVKVGVFTRCPQVKITAGRVSGPKCT